MAPGTEQETTYVLVDGENIDATLGNSILGGRPLPEQRPRWERVRDFAVRRWGGTCKPLFFLDASNGQLPSTFVQALLAMNFRPIPLAGAPDEKVVDIAITRTLEALLERQGNVLLVSHDGDFARPVTALVERGRRVGVLGFQEFVSGAYKELASRGLELFDLEDDVRAFNVPLPRLRIVPIEEFDPADFL
jgi:uncharacterized protein